MDFFASINIPNVFFSDFKCFKTRFASFIYYLLKADVMSFKLLS